MRKRSILNFAAFAAALAVTSSAWATPTLTDIVTFNGNNGSSPYSDLTADPAGNLYGTTSGGGPTNGRGTVYEVTVGQHVLSTLATFNGTNGQTPVGGVLRDTAGNLYGTTTTGGTDDDGVVYEVAAATHALSTFATFTGTNGYISDSNLITDSAGNFYGTTAFGGPSGNGEIFEIAAGMHTLTTLAAFDGTNGDPYNSLTLDAAGNLYGTTYQGRSNSDGAVFEIQAGTQNVTTLASFNASTGYWPAGKLIADAAGNLYGTTNGGGPGNAGTVFEVSATTHILSILASFNNTNGAYPLGGLIADAAGNLYGTTSYGGTNDDGTVFKVTAGTHALSTLATFNGTNGSDSGADLYADAAGNLYGTTRTDGAGQGVIFEVTGTGFAVPEPTTLSLLIVATPALLARRRSKRASRSGSTQNQLVGRNQP